MRTFPAALLLVAHLAAVTAAHAEEPPAFLLKWGGTGSADGQFDRPTAISVGPDGSVYVMDTYNWRIQKFTSDGTFILKWPATADNMEVGPDGTIYTHYLGVVTKYDQSGNLLWQSGNSIGPSGPIAIDPTGQYIYVCGAYVVGQYTVAGSHIRSWDTFVHSNTRNSGIAVGPDGDVYVAEGGLQSRVWQFTGDGVFVRYWGGSGSGDGQLFGPRGVTVDGDGNVYVCDSGNERMEKFTAEGSFLSKWSVTGTASGHFGPYDVAVDGDGNVYVVDYANDKVQKFGDVATPTVKTTWGRIKSLYRGAEPTDER